MADLQSFIDTYQNAIVNISVVIVVAACVIGLVKILITLVKSHQRKIF